jgi:hypothetical protein
MIAAASSSGFALGINSLAAGVSEKIGRTSKVHPWQIAGAAELLFADKIPATKVLCMHAKLLARVHVPRSLPGISRTFSPVRSGWSMTTGPSTKPITISGLPLVSSINGVRLTKSKTFNAFVSRVKSGERGIAIPSRLDSSAYASIYSYPPAAIALRGVPAKVRPPWAFLTLVEDALKRRMT